MRDLGCDAGIVITASHNPKEYNGYKVYGPDGCQITTEMAGEIPAAIDAVDPFDGVKAVDFDAAIAAGTASWIGEDTLDRYVAVTLARSTGQDLSSLKLAYTPLNGTGRELVTRVLAERGCTDVTLVPEQAEPNGDFPTCPYPNPEIREALQLGIELAEREGADLLLATDPGADRVGIAVRHNGSNELLNGNEVGLLLLDWLVRRAVAAGAKASSLVACTTVVSAPMTDDLARDLGFELRRTLTASSSSASRRAFSRRRAERPTSSWALRRATATSPVRTCATRTRWSRPCLSASLRRRTRSKGATSTMPCRCSTIATDTGEASSSR